MERQAILNEFSTWPTQEQKAFVAELVGRLKTVGNEQDIKPFLEERLAAADTNPDDSYSWEEVLTYLRRVR